MHVLYALHQPVLLEGGGGVMNKVSFQPQQDHVADCARWIRGYAQAHANVGVVS